QGACELRQEIDEHKGLNPVVLLEIDRSHLKAGLQKCVTLFKLWLILVGPKHSGRIEIRIGGQRKDAIHHLGFSDRNLVARAADAWRPAHSFTVDSLGI